MKSTMKRIEHCWTITPLGANGVYTSAWQKVSLYPRLPTATIIEEYYDTQRIVGHVITDQNSAVPAGLVIQYSLDGVNVSSWAPGIAVVANVPTNFDIRLFGTFVRLVYTNGAIPQTTLVLQAFVEEQ